MSMLLVNGVAVKDPSVFTWGLNDISASDAGRTNDLLMHKARLGQKRTISLEWAMPTPAEAAAILTAFNPEYIDVTYPDAMSNTNETRTFYVSDRSAPMQQWFIGGQRYSKISFNIIER